VSLILATFAPVNQYGRQLLIKPKRNTGNKKSMENEKKKT
jgi:hypothetical protein